MASPSIVSYANKKIAADNTGTFLSTDITVTFQDLDAPDLLKYTITPRLNNLGGTLSLISQDDSGTGTVGFVSYNYSLASANVASLAKDQVAYQVFTVTATDKAGNAKSQDVVITITGTNDAPVVGFLPNITVKEGARDLVLDLLSGAKDLDSGDKLSVKELSYTIDNGAPTVVTAEKPAPFLSAVSTDGKVTFKASDVSLDSISAGSTRTILLNYLVSDQEGAKTAQSQTIIVTGTNDAPTLTPEAAKGLIGFVDKGAFQNFNLLRGASDVDAGDNLYLENVKFTVNGVSMGGATPAGVSLNGTTLAVDGANAAFSGLYNTQSSTITVAYQIQDSFGAFVTQTQTITVKGAGTKPEPINQAPIVGYLQEQRVSEGSNDLTLNLLSGASDPDKNTLSVEDLTYAIGNGTPIVVTADKPAPFLSAVTTDGKVTFNAKHASFDSISEGSTRSILLNYLVTDGKGGKTEQSQSIVVTGINDAPTVEKALTATVDKGKKETIDLLVGASDVDAGDNLYLANVNFSLNGKSMGGATPTGVSFNGTSLVVDATNAAFSGVYKDTPSTIVVDYLVKDSRGASVKQSDTITIRSEETTPNLKPVNNTLTSDGKASISIDGSAEKVGNSLMANTSQLAESSLMYQWFRAGLSDPMKTIKIEGASSNTYTITQSDVGHFVSVEVVAGLQSYSALTYA
jgi:VCBS repeat-containing protein